LTVNSHEQGVAMLSAVLNSQRAVRLCLPRIWRSSPGVSARRAKNFASRGGANRALVFHRRLKNRHRATDYTGYMNWSAMGAAGLALAVILGAFGAHGLRGRLDENSMSIYHTAVLYHFIHALGILIVSILPRAGMLPVARAAWVCGLLCFGVVIFSGSLYVLAISGKTWLGAITPFGGLAFIVGWVLLAYFLVRAKA
jgi:uncharacterized membrane protein YgdD (TMEM256/DUF423 family)